MATSLSTPGIRLRPMTLFNPVFNRQTPIVIKRLKTQADEGLTPADEAGYVVLRQPPASKLANLFRIDVRDHALGLVTQQLGGRVTEHPPGEWLEPRTPSLREGPGSASVASGSPDPVAAQVPAGAALRSWGSGAVQVHCKDLRSGWSRDHGRSSRVAAVLLALCRLVVHFCHHSPFSPLEACRSRCYDNHNRSVR